MAFCLKRSAKNVLPTAIKSLEGRETFNPRIITLGFASASAIHFRHEDAFMLGILLRRAELQRSTVQPLFLVKVSGHLLKSCFYHRHAHPLLHKLLPGWL